ncbi:late competence development ComFB family protein [Ruminococcaceae bacterium OttesenSCG-928-I18]|nr:late competence development ComFB family protein [Ruminococcaceae bacterium OttesenSCG-928-I18]
MVKNYMQEQVAVMLEEELEDHGEKYKELCQCPACIAAVQAAALNHLPPFYVTCVAGEVFGEYRNKELQNYSDILVAIAKGVEETLRDDPNGHMRR